MTTRISHNKLTQNIKNFYKTTLLAVNSTTNTTDRTSDMKKPHTTDGKTQKSPDSMISTVDHTSHTSLRSRRQLQLARWIAGQFPSVVQKPNKDTETPKHKTLNNSLVLMKEVSSTTWKSRQNHAPSHTYGIDTPRK